MLAFYYNFCTVKLELLNSLACVQLRWGILCKRQSKYRSWTFCSCSPSQKGPSSAPHGWYHYLLSTSKPQRDAFLNPQHYSVCSCLFECLALGRDTAERHRAVWPSDALYGQSLQKTVQHLHTYNTAQLLKVSREFRHPWLCQLLWWE